MMISSGGGAIINMISSGGGAIINMISSGGGAIINMISGGGGAIIMISSGGGAIISRRVCLHVWFCGVRQEAVLVQTRAKDYHWLGWRSLPPQMRDVFIEDALQGGEFDSLHSVG
jgi:hypothetical protein